MKMFWTVVNRPPTPTFRCCSVPLASLDSSGAPRLATTAERPPLAWPPRGARPHEIISIRRSATAAPSLGSHTRSGLDHDGGLGRGGPARGLVHLGVPPRRPRASHVPLRTRVDG